MTMIRLEYRISHAHIGKGMIEVPGVRTHTHNLYWSCARHLPENWDRSKIGKRRSVAGRLLENLEQAKEGEIDLGPLRDDQRASGVIYGSNPLQHMYDIIGELTNNNPEYPFFVKWGGGRFELPGKGFAFYVEDEKDAALMLERLYGIALKMHVPIDARHRYGVEGYQDFVTVDQRLRSLVKNNAHFRSYLEDIIDYPYFFHEVFSSNI